MSFFAELKRRNVYRVAIAYAVVAWLLMQVGTTLAPALHLPEWVNSAVVFFLLLGFPLALLFAWAFEVTPQGIRREKHVDRTQSITAQTGRKLDFLIIGVLAIALAWLGYDKLVLDPKRDAALAQSVSEAARSGMAVSVEPPQIETTTQAGPSIAVLPFTNMSGDEDYFADGLSEELLNLLAQLPDLKVAGRTSSFSFKGQHQDLRTIGAALGVNHVLEGSVRRSGDRLRITAQLVSVADGFHVWSQTYDRTMADIFDIQDEVASAITQALEVRLVPREEKPTESVEAYTAYLQGLGLLTRQDNLAAIENVQRAAQIDPSFDEAYSMLASLYWLGAGVSTPNVTAQLKCFEYASKALALDPDTLMARAFAESCHPSDYSMWREDRAMKALVDAEPSNILAYYAYLWNLTRYGYFNEASEYLSHVVELDPLSAVAYEYEGQIRTAQGRFDEALVAWRRCVNLDATEYCSELAAIGLLLRGRDSEAANWLVGHSRIGLGDAAGATAFIAGARDEASGLEFLREFIRQSPVTGSNEFRSPYVHTWLLAFGHLDEYWEALRILQGNRRNWSDGENLEQVGTIFRESGFTAHPHYLEQVAWNGIAELWDERGPPDHCVKRAEKWACR